MDAMQRLDRMIKLMVALITLGALALIGLRIVGSRSLRIDPRRECEAAGRRYDAQRHICLPHA
jgi:hypothetical protein